MCCVCGCVCVVGGLSRCKFCDKLHFSFLLGMIYVVV